MKVITVVGARPQFVKASTVSNKLKKAGIKEVIVNTGQHYDFNLSELFFQQLNIPKSKYNLKVGSGNHGIQTGEMLKKLEPVFEKESPDFVLVYGDTNSTLAGALVASKMNIPVAHIEAGLRSFNRNMPEEVNRVLTDHISTILFCPSSISKLNLKNEGIEKNVFVVGDVMYDIFKKFEHKIDSKNHYGNYCLLTIHRAENTNKISLTKRFEQLSNIDFKIVFPIHPRTRKIISEYSVKIPKNIKIIEPVGWFDMISLIKNSHFVITDSGGIQKESLWCKKICITLRNETEWIETLKQKVNILFKENSDFPTNSHDNLDFSNPYGDGNSSDKIIKFLINHLKEMK